MSHNVSAVGVWIDNFGARVNHWQSGACNHTDYNAGYLYNQTFWGCQLTGVQVYSQNVTASGNGVLWGGKFNVVKRMYKDSYTGVIKNAWRSDQGNISFIGVKFGNVDIDVQNISYNYWTTFWYANASDNTLYETLTIAWTLTGNARSNIDGQTGKLTMAVFPNSWPSFDDNFLPNATESPYYFENTNEALEVQFTSNGLEGLNELVQQNAKFMQQNQTMINQNQQIINMAQDRNAKEDQSLDNISNQSSGDISDAENAQTTNIIGVIQSFITQLGSFSATSCNMSLPFPSFLGGDTSVNICQGKDVLGNFISVVGSLFMITFYIPLAFVLLRMIYNEIRSFTNG